MCLEDYLLINARNSVDWGLACCVASTCDNRILYGCQLTTQLLQLPVDVPGKVTKDDSGAFGS